MLFEKDGRNWEEEIGMGVGEEEEVFSMDYIKPRVVTTFMRSQSKHSARIEIEGRGME
jgi:hypothetical protein